MNGSQKRLDASRRPPRIIRSRTTSLVAGFAALLLVLWCIYTLLDLARFGDEARLATFLHSQPEGTRLSLGELRANEQIVVTHVRNGHRDWSAQTFTFTGGEAIGVAIEDHTLAWNAGRDLRVGSPTLASSHVLTAVQIEGVDALLRLVRVPQPAGFRYYDTYEITYVRDG